MFEPLSKYSAIVQARYHASGMPRFLRWWTGELRPLIPESVKRWFEIPGDKLLITSEADAWLLWRSGSDAVQLLDRLSKDADPEQSRDRLQACLDKFQETLTAVVYCLPDDQLLCKRLRLPMAAEANLQQAVRFELDRQTPFKADEVYFDIKVVQRDAPFIDVDLFLILRPEIEDSLQQLGRLGLNLQGVDIDHHSGSTEQQEPRPPTPLHINLLPLEKRAHRSNRRVRINGLLAAVALLLMAVLMYESLYLRGSTLQQLQQQRDALRSEAMQVTKLEQQLEAAVDAANFLAEQQSQSPSMLDVIAEVTRLLPAHTWIQRLQMTGKELELLGLSDSSQQMIETLDASPMFAGTSFKGTIATDQRLHKERFTATAQIDPSASFVSPNQSDDSQSPQAAVAADQQLESPAVDAAAGTDAGDNDNDSDAAAERDSRDNDATEMNESNDAAAA